MEAYTAELAGGKARWIERDTADGLIGERLGNLHRCKDLLARRTAVENGHRRLKIDGNNLLPATTEQAASARNLLKQVVSTT